jgi:hypothetical protein
MKLRRFCRRFLLLSRSFFFFKLPFLSCSSLGFQQTKPPQKQSNQERKENNLCVLHPLHGLDHGFSQLLQMLPPSRSPSQAASSSSSSSSSFRCFCLLALLPKLLPLLLRRPPPSSIDEQSALLDRNPNGTTETLGPKHEFN